MSLRARVIRVRNVAATAASITAAVAVLAGCGSPLAGSAVAATGSVVGGSAAAPSDRASGSVSVSAPDAASPGGWSAVVESGPGGGIPSPTGDFSAGLNGNVVCFVPETGPKRCGSMAAEATATFAVFSPAGTELLVVGGPATAAGVYVFDAADGSARMLGPQGVYDYSPESAPAVWDLSSAAWAADGTAVFLVPRTTEQSGPVLRFDLTSGAVSTPLRLDAALANSSPSLWTTRTGLAVVANSGDQRNSLWWLDFATGAAKRIASFGEPGGSLALLSADPLGRFAVICPRRADGALGATIGVAVEHTESRQLLPDSPSCAGSVSSADGTYLASTAEVDGSYLLIVEDVARGRRVLTAPLPVPAPSGPPYLTWVDDVIVAADVTREWPTPSVVIRLHR